MGVTLGYRGGIADLGRIEDFEDRVLDLALELGGQARIWRSADEDDPRRIIRGVMVDLFPGQETTSLLLSPEGWLIGLAEIEDAEKGRLQEPPWCFVKTQFGSVEGHVALVETLAALKKEFLPNLEVEDEGGYWETRDVAALARKMQFVQKAIEQMTEGLQRHGLSPEAVEDPEILASRIERIAGLVHRTLSRPAEHPPVHWDDEDLGAGDLEGGVNEAKWDESFKENRRRQERMSRAIEERLARGEDIAEAFDGAMHDEVVGGLEEPSDDSSEEPLEPSDDWMEDEADEPWKESLPEAVRDEDGDADEDDPFDRVARHPLQRRVMDLMVRLDELFKGRTAAQSSHETILFRGAGEMLGGLAQALTDEDDWGPDRGLAVVQLKRALRGAAFALGTLFPLRADGTLDEPTFRDLHKTIETLQDDIFAELCRLRHRGAP